MPKRSFKIKSQLGWQWAHVLRACVLFRNKFNFGLHKFKNKLVFCHPRIIYKIPSLSSASWNSLYTSKPTWYTFFKCSADSSHQLQKKNSHIPDICCPQMVKNLFKNSPILDKKSLVKGSACSLTVLTCGFLWLICRGSCHQWQKTLHINKPISVCETNIVCSLTSSNYQWFFSLFYRTD